MNSEIKQYITCLLEGTSVENRRQLQTEAEFIIQDIYDASQRIANIRNLPHIYVFRKHATEFVNKIVKIPVAGRLSVLTNERLSRSVHQLNHSAFAVAQEWFKEPTDLVSRKQLLLKAEIIKNKLDVLQAELIATVPEWQTLYGRQFSESRLDINYVLGEKRRVSLRMSRLFRGREQVRRSKPLRRR